MRDWIIVWIVLVSPNKSLSLWVRFGASVIIGLLDVIEGIRPIEVIVLAYLFSGWFIHDSLLAMGTCHKPWYLNSTGPIDRAQASIGPAAWAIKGIGFFGTLFYYFVNYA